MSEETTHSMDTEIAVRMASMMTTLQRLILDNQKLRRQISDLRFPNVKSAEPKS